jgi:hypothetical protein
METSLPTLFSARVYVNLPEGRRYHHQRRRRSLLQDISGLTYLSGVMLDLGGNDKDISRTSNFSS